MTTGDPELRDCPATPHGLAAAVASSDWTDEDSARSHFRQRVEDGEHYSRRIW